MAASFVFSPAGLGLAKPAGASGAPPPGVNHRRTPPPDVHCIVRRISPPTTEKLLKGYRYLSHLPLQKAHPPSPHPPPGAHPCFRVVFFLHHPSSSPPPSQASATASEFALAPARAADSLRGASPPPHFGAWRAPERTVVRGLPPSSSAARWASTSRRRPTAAPKT